MTSLLTALFLAQPALAPSSNPPAEKHCYFIRIFPIPKDFKDRIEIPPARTPARMDEVSPNCWAAPPANLVRPDKPSSPMPPAQAAPAASRPGKNGQPK
ncbi:MAG: hypothetical protein HXY18_00340 [Bryobacteraceae bacterium]|nr:hypothetical protein [Bryobacteraceae bacterium]